MIAAEDLRKLRDRLEAGDPIRIVVGEKLYDATELHLGAAYEARLRAMMIREAGEEIEALERPKEPEAAT